MSRFEREQEVRADELQAAIAPDIQDRVIVVPSQKSVEFILANMGGCPFDYDNPDTWNVTVFCGIHSIPSAALDPMGVYNAYVHKLDYWYDEHTGLTNLVLVLKSDALKQRNQVLEAGTGIKSEHPIYVPSMVLVHGFPQLSSSYKNFVNSLSNSFHRMEEPLQFSSEILMDSDGHAPNVAGMKYYASKFA